MVPLPFSQSGTRIAFFAIFGIWLLLEWRIRIRSHLNKQGSRVDRGGLVIVVAFVSAGLAGGFLLAENVHRATIPDVRWPLFVIGLVLMCAGIAIRQWSVALLGRFFTVDVRVHPNQTVVEGGPYRWVRHPSYTGLIITFLGLGLALGNWAALAVLAVVPTAGLVLRIHSEEQALLAGLGEPYRRFAATRAHLFPGLW
jgi:protein-S-isoprenylcysteine O-methyltransferase Ste14